MAKKNSRYYQLVHGEPEKEEIEATEPEMDETEDIEPEEPETPEKKCCGKCGNVKPQIKADLALEIIQRHFAGYEMFLSCIQDAVVYRRKVNEFAALVIQEINERYKEAIALSEAE